MYFTIQAADAFGNPREEGGDLFAVDIRGPAQLRGVHDNGNGTYSCAYELASEARNTQVLPEGAFLHIDVCLAGESIRNSPFQVQLQHEVPDRHGQAAAVLPHNQAHASSSAVNSLPSMVPMPQVF